MAIGAQPFLVRSANTAWAAADAARERIYARLVTYLEQNEIDALVVKSVDFTVPAWVELRAWLPEGESASDRVRLTIWITVKPHFEYPLEVTVSYLRRSREHSVPGLLNFGEAEAAGWAAFVLGRGPDPENSAEKLRRGQYDIWRPVNKVKDLGRDPYGIGVFLLVVLGAIGAIDMINGGAGLALVVLVVFATVLLGIFAGRRKVLTVNAGKPEGEPRHLRLVDSWHTTLLGLGGEATALRERARTEFASHQLPQLSIREERVAAVGVDGKQERDQLILRLGRGMLFCHIYDYGSDLFIGWDAYANLGEWTEIRVASGYNRERRTRVSINSVQPGLYRLTEYDLIDLDCLTEWTHARLTTLVKRVMAERQIDQEIDFAIIRGQRQSLFQGGGADDGSAAVGGTRSAAGGGARSGFSRAG